MQYEAVSEKNKLRTCPHKWVQHCIVSKTAIAFRSLEVVSNGLMSFHFDSPLIFITVDCVFVLDEQSLLYDLNTNFLFCEESEHGCLC